MILDIMAYTFAVCVCCSRVWCVTAHVCELHVHKRVPCAVRVRVLLSRLQLGSAGLGSAAAWLGCGLARLRLGSARSGSAAAAARLVLAPFCACVLGSVGLAAARSAVVRVRQRLRLGLAAWIGSARLACSSARLSSVARLSFGCGSAAARLEKATARLEKAARWWRRWWWW